MAARQAAHLLQQPLLHSVWPRAAAPGPLWATAAAAAQLSSAGGGGGGLTAADAFKLPLLQGINWRGLAADATAAPNVPPATATGDTPPWSSGVTTSSSSSSTSTSTSSSSGHRQGPPQPAVLQPAMFANSFRSPISSLQFNRGEVVYLPQLEGNMVGRTLLWAVGAYSRKQQLRNGASVMYQGITEAAENPELQQALGLEVGSFMAPFNLLSLHMWLVINRLHQEPDSKDNKLFLDCLYHDYFYKDIERRVYAHGVQIRVSKWVDRLQKQFYGTSFAYDKAIRVEGGSQAQHAAFVAALLKNVYNGDEANRPWAELMARYLIRELQCLSETDAAAIYKGHIRFSADVVRR